MTTRNFWVCRHTVDDDVEAGRASSSEGAGVVYLVFQGGQVGLMLQLLVLPGDSYYEWQRIRLERIRIVEPDLASVVPRAHEQLSADVRRDREAVDLLQTEDRSW